VQNEANLVRLRRIQNPLFDKGLRKSRPFGGTQKRTQTNPNEPKTNPIFGPPAAPKAKTNPNEPNLSRRSLPAAAKYSTKPGCEAGTNPISHPNIPSTTRPDFLPPTCGAFVSKFGRKRGTINVGYGFFKEV